MVCNSVSEEWKTKIWWCSSEFCLPNHFTTCSSFSSGRSAPDRRAIIAAEPATRGPVRPHAIPFSSCTVNYYQFIQFGKPTGTRSKKFSHPAPSTSISFRIPRAAAPRPSDCNEVSYLDHALIVEWFGLSKKDTDHWNSLLSPSYQYMSSF